jgi:hypothetical protein
MSHGIHQAAYLSLRIPHTLDADLARAAEREANTKSSVARRLIAAGLARERRADTGLLPGKPRREGQ